ncbi:hypothetical protein KAI46_14240, partial [bacterium]|nr:hypothetical protein [bacterium]
KPGSDAYRFGRRSSFQRFEIRSKYRLFCITIRPDAAGYLRVGEIKKELALNKKLAATVKTLKERITNT